MKKIVALMVTALMTLSLSSMAFASSHKKEEAAPVAPAAEKVEKKDAKKVKKAPAKKEAKPAAKGKKEMSGC